MAEIVDILIDLLCQQNTAQQCIQFVNNYTDVVQQLLFLVFFPAVFIILFVFLVSKGITSNITGGKFQVLLGFAIFIFIVVQGWYHFFLLLSQFWFVFLIILVGLWLFIYRMLLQRGGGDGGGGHGRGQASLAKIGPDSIRGKLYRKYVSKQKKDIVHHIETELRNLENIKRDLHNNKGTGDYTRLREIFTNTLERVEHHLDELRKEEEVGGIVVLGGDYKRLEKRLHDLTKEVDMGNHRKAA